MRQSKLIKYWSTGSLLMICFLITAIVNAQSVAINNDGSPPHANAILDVKSTTKGLLVPRMTSAQRNAMPAVQGMLVYDTDLNKFYSNNGVAWIEQAAGGATNYWSPNSSNIYNNNVGNIGIGVSDPAFKLDIGMRIRLRSQNGSETAGMWLNKADNSGTTGFIGVYDNSTMGLYGNSSGWGLTMNTVSGNVGIGTITPANKLTVYSNFYGIEHTDGSVRLSSFLNSQGGWLGTLTNHPLNFYTNDGAAAMTVTPGGGIGINTTNPTPGYYLDVAGPVKSVGNTTHFVAQTTGSTNSWARYYMRSNGQSWFMGTSQNFIGNQLYIADETFGHTRFTIQPNNGLIWMSTTTGVGINTTNTAGYMLAVNGKIRSTELVVETGWADYVFDKNYKLRPLNDLEKFIQQNKHLPNIPSAAEIEANGLHVGDVQKRMMEKIEELTLYIIDLKKEIDQLKILRNEK
jgi:hypothetical protein